MPMSSVVTPLKQEREVMLGFVPLIGGLVLATFLLYYGVRGERVNFEEVGLGYNTKSVFARIDGKRIHCDDFGDDRQSADECVAAALQRGGMASALWLGNSQLHGLNDQKDGETTAIPLLYESLDQHGIDLITLSQPNATLQEHYVMFEYVRNHLPLRLLILPVFLDDLREEGVRAGVARALSDPGTTAALGDTEIGRRIRTQYTPAAPGHDKGATEGTIHADLAALDQTVQEATEEALTEWLNEHSRLWESRPQMRGRLITKLKELRKTAFRVTPSTERPVIPAHYNANMAALRATVQSARANGISVLLYIPPIRSDVKIPYVAEEYARFKAEVEQIATESGSGFANLEVLVPGELWGMKASTSLSKEPEYDFMHFKAAGHTLLAGALMSELERQMISPTGLGRPTGL